MAVSANGSVVSANSSAVDPGVSGTVTELNVSLGSNVKKGDTLFVIDNPDLDASVVQAKASYQNAQSSMAKAKQTKTQASVSKNTERVAGQEAVPVSKRRRRAKADSSRSRRKST